MIKHNEFPSRPSVLTPMVIVGFTGTSAMAQIASDVEVTFDRLGILRNDVVLHPSKPGPWRGRSAE